MLTPFILTTIINNNFKPYKRHNESDIVVSRPAEPLPKLALIQTEQDYIYEQSPAVAPKNGPVGANGYYAGYCTFWVAINTFVPPGLGNANLWAVNAQAMGYTVSNTPIVGSVAQTSTGAEGHVALVVAVSGTQVLVSEMNYTGWNQTDQRWADISDFVYIYF